MYSGEGWNLVKSTVCLWQDPPQRCCRQGNRLCWRILREAEWWWQAHRRTEWTAIQPNYAHTWKNKAGLRRYYDLKTAFVCPHTNRRTYRESMSEIGMCKYVQTGTKEEIHKVVNRDKRFNHKQTLIWSASSVIPLNPDHQIASLGVKQAPNRFSSLPLLLTANWSSLLHSMTIDDFNDLVGWNLLTTALFVEIFLSLLSAFITDE